MRDLVLWEVTHCSLKENFLEQVIPIWQDLQGESYWMNAMFKLITVTRLILWFRYDNKSQTLKVPKIFRRRRR